MMGISIWQLAIILVIVLLLFGTKKLRNVGGDLGGAIKSFRKAVKDGGSAAKADGTDEADGTDGTDETKKVEQTDDVIEGEVTSKEKDKA